MDREADDLNLSPLRPLEREDLGKGYLALLSELTRVGEVKTEDAIARFEEIDNHPDYRIRVIEEMREKKIVATGTLFIEKKFIHGLSCSGHIEDIVVRKDRRGQGLAREVIQGLKKEAQSAGCYKVILDCAPGLKIFYDSLGFEEKGIQMAIYF